MKKPEDVIPQKQLPELIQEQIIRDEARAELLKEQAEAKKGILDQPQFAPGVEKGKRQVAEIEARVEGLYRDLARVKSLPASEQIALLQRLEEDTKSNIRLLETLAGPEYGTGMRRAFERSLKRIYIPSEGDPPKSDAFKSDLRTLKRAVEEETQAYGLNLKHCQSLLDKIEKERDRMVSEYEAGLRDGQKQAERQAKLAEIASLESEKYKLGKAIADRRHNKK